MNAACIAACNAATMAASNAALMAARNANRTATANAARRREARSYEFREFHEPEYPRTVIFTSQEEKGHGSAWGNVLIGVLVGLVILAGGALLWVMFS